MAPNPVIKSCIPLRVVTQRLSIMSTKELPHIAPRLAASITQCRKTFGSSQDDGTDESGAGMVVHKLKTQISALLQDRSPSARYAAIILIKATIEVGGWNVLQAAGPWVRGLIAIIGVSHVERPKGQSLQNVDLYVETLSSFSI